MSELFEKFEVNRDPRWQILTKLLIASLVVHLGLLWAVIYVPALRDTVNLAALIATTRFVDKDYQATQIGDGVQMVELARFRYPDGYFALEAQIEGKLPAQSPASDPFAPKIISQAGSNRDVDPEASPSPSPEASPSPNASPGASASPSAAVAEASPNSSPLTQEEAQKQLEKTAEESKIPLPAENEINKKPLKDLAAHMQDLKNQGKLDLNKPFEIVVEAELDENGKLTKAKFAKQEGDVILQDLFSRMIGALNDSGLMIFLQPISKDNPGATVRITIKQGEQEVLASIESETSSSKSASDLAKALNGLLVAGAWARAGKNEAELMKNSTASPDGKKVVVHFSMPRQTVVDMIKKQMQPGV
jgi:hypothetical protein